MKNWKKLRVILIQLLPIFGLFIYRRWKALQKEINSWSFYDYIDIALLFVWIWTWIKIVQMFTGG